MDFNLCTIASGSSGNCIYLKAGSDEYLIDIGISGKKVEQGLAEMGVNPYQIKGIFVTHEHIDHIKGVGIFSRKNNIPIYATKDTWDMMDKHNMIGKVIEENKKTICKEQVLQLGDLKVFPYATYHDAADPVGYIFEYNEKKIGIITDSGIIDGKIKGYLSGLHGILLEFNHDINMLEAGSYPYPLKKRILSDSGHLSNELAAKTLVDIYHQDMQWAILAHLSKDNNIPDLAYITIKNALEQKNLFIDKDIEITIANRDSLSKMHYL